MIGSPGADAPASLHRSIGRPGRAGETDSVRQRTRPDLVAQRALDFGEARPIGPFSTYSPSLDAIRSASPAAV